MPNRRDFIKTVAGATTGALMMSSAHAEASPQGRGGAGAGGGGGAAGAPTGPMPRRIVQVGGKRVRVVDVHAHATVAEVAQVVAGTEFARNANGRPMGDERIWEMDKRGIDIQVLD